MVKAARPVWYSEYSDWRPATLRFPLYSLSVTLPLTFCWVLSMKASSASRSGVNQRP